MVKHTFYYYQLIVYVQNVIVHVCNVQLIHHIVKNVNQIYHYMIINVMLQDVNQVIIKQQIVIKY